jgi:hypothetical protein
MVIPRSLMALTPATRTRAMKATRVFAGATSYCPHPAMRLSKRSNSSRARSPLGCSQNPLDLLLLLCCWPVSTR